MKFKSGSEHAGYTHGQSNKHRTPEYDAWRSMKKRCYCKTSLKFPLYGGRGISVCARWRDSFDNFFADMGPKPAGLSLERLDSEGDYEPTNCIWADATRQNRNRRNNIRVEFRGRTVLLGEAASALGISYQTAAHRIAHGEDCSVALYAPPNYKTAFAEYLSHAALTPPPA